MAVALHAPRINNNDDVVQVVALHVGVGDYLKKGEIALEVETDKAVVEVAAESDGYVLKLLCAVDDKVMVGSTLLWQGSSLEEQVPELQPSRSGDGTRQVRPTAKASARLKELDLDASAISAAGERLTLADVNSHIAAHGIQQRDRTIPAEENLPDVPGELVDLSAEGHGMLNNVAWHREHASATYLELEYDPKAWEEKASAYARANKLMLSPLLPLLAYRLVQLAKANPRLNATIVNGKRFEYQPVNLGFTVQAGEMLYLTVVRDADTLDSKQFVEALGEVQRHALKRKLSRQETTGATIAFSSMARWNVSRHIPILPPYCSLMVAHAAPKDSGRAVLGASYDHRLLSGFDVARLLMELAKPNV
jgi:pyruvate/2-oxoglutarate dehydrogenase complex dihydrolipoamide acyltransferase (E2) component